MLYWTFNHKKKKMMQFNYINKKLSLKLFFLYSTHSSTRNWETIHNRRDKVQGLNKTAYELALEYLGSDKNITAAEINKVLSLTGFSIDQNTLDFILSKPRLSFNKLSPDTLLSKIFLDKIGTVRNEKNKAGVYIWTYVATGSMYVGSSCSIARRLSGYFKGTHASVGRFIPLLRKEGLNTFTLDVIVLNEEYYEGLELCLEQYFLLHNKYDLNTLRVVNNISGSRSKALFLYTKDLSQLIFSSEKQEDFIFKLGIHHSIIQRSLKHEYVYLGKYIFTDYLIKGIKLSNLTEVEVSIMLEEDRLAALPKEGRQIKLIAEGNDSDVQTFSSIKDCLEFLKSKDRSANKSTFYKYLGSGKSYKGFNIEWANDNTFHIKDKSVSVFITDINKGKVDKYLSFRQAALALGTTGQTVKAYLSSGKLYKDNYLISSSISDLETGKD